MSLQLREDSYLVLIARYTYILLRISADFNISAISTSGYSISYSLGDFTNEFRGIVELSLAVLLTGCLVGV